MLWGPSAFFIRRGPPAVNHLNIGGGWWSTCNILTRWPAIQDDHHFGIENSEAGHLLRKRLLTDFLRLETQAFSPLGLSIAREIDIWWWQISVSRDLFSYKNSGFSVNFALFLLFLVGILWHDVFRFSRKNSRVLISWNLKLESWTSQFCFVIESDLQFWGTFKMCWKSGKITIKIARFWTLFEFEIF